MGDHRLLTKRAMSGELENAGQCVTVKGKEKEWADCVEKALQAFRIAGKWSITTLMPIYNGTIHYYAKGVQSFNGMAAWARQEKALESGGQG